MGNGKGLFWYRIVSLSVIHRGLGMAHFLGIGYTFMGMQRIRVKDFLSLSYSY